MMIMNRNEFGSLIGIIKFYVRIFVHNETLRVVASPHNRRVEKLCGNARQSSVSSIHQSLLMKIIALRPKSEIHDSGLPHAKPFDNKCEAFMYSKSCREWKIVQLRTADDLGGGIRFLHNSSCCSDENSSKSSLKAPRKKLFQLIESASFWCRSFAFPKSCRN